MILALCTACDRLKEVSSDEPVVKVIFGNWVLRSDKRASDRGVGARTMKVHDSRVVNSLRKTVAWAYACAPDPKIRRFRGSRFGGTARSDSAEPNVS
jgi:hypothetical protein